MPTSVHHATRKAADPLTIAYVTLGAKAALDASNGAGNQQAGGELDFLSEVIDHAPLLDDLSRDKDFQAVFVYEVAEPFGNLIAQRLIEGDELNDEFVRSTAEELIAAACGD